MHLLLQTVKLHLLLHPTLPPGHFHETITVPLPAPGKGEDGKMNKEKDKSHLCIGDRVEIAARIGCAKTTVSREVKGHYSVVLESDENGQMGMRTFSWTNNLLIMTACKTDEEKEFYIRACIENHYLFSLTRSI